MVIPAFVNAGRAVPRARPRAQRPAGVVPARSPGRPPAAACRGSGRWERLAGRRPWAVAGVLVVVPALAAGVTIAALPAAQRAAPPPSVTVTQDRCAPEFTPAESGDQTFTVTNNSGMAGEISLDNAAGGGRRRDRDARPGHVARR